jgi:hypothetical protein
MLFKTTFTYLFTIIHFLHVSFILVYTSRLIVFIYCIYQVHSGTNGHIALMCRKESIQTNKSTICDPSSTCAKFLQASAVWWYYFQQIPNLQVEANELSSLWTSEWKSLHCNTLRNWNPLLLTQLPLAFSNSTALFCSSQNPKTLCHFNSESQSERVTIQKSVNAPYFSNRMNHRLNTRNRFECVDESHLSSPVFSWLLKPPEFLYAILAPNDMYPQTSSNQNWSRLLADLVFQGIYTDGLKAGAAVASAAMSGQKFLVKRLPNISSIFSAEARCISTSADHHRVCCSWWIPQYFQYSLNTLSVAFRVLKIDNSITL